MPPCSDGGGGQWYRSHRGWERVWAVQWWGVFGRPHAYIGIDINV